MVKITNGVVALEVTNGAYESIYRYQGYKPVEDKVDEKKAEGEQEPKAPEKSDDEKFAEEIVKKPISQWNKEEVKRFAAIKNLDITGTKSANEAKEIIKTFLAEGEQE